MKANRNHGCKANRNQGRPEYARTTITVPRPLKRRMKRQGPLVNWSAVATAAFREKLKEVEPDAESCSLEAVVERLRQTRQGGPAADPDASEGHQAGRRWAMQRATLPQLERLSAFREGHNDEEWQKFTSAERSGLRLARQIAPHVKGPRRFWVRVLGDVSGRSPAFFAAFASGALEVWNEVKNQI